jgi:two-component system, NarL family, nitrate/nitrite sensor histidine kinase NarX
MNPEWAVLLLSGASLIGIICIVVVIHMLRQQLIKPLTRLRTTPLLQNRSVDQDIRFGDLAGDISHLGDELKLLTEDMDIKVRTQTKHIASKSRSLEILYEIATSLSTAHNLDELLEQFLDTLMILVDAKAASVRLLTDDGMTRLVSSRGLNEETIKQEYLVDINRCMCGDITIHGGFGIQQGVAACEKFNNCKMIDGDCSELIVVPLQYRDKILGVYNLFLERPSAELGNDARDLLNSIGKHLGLAVEKSRLDDNARRLAIMEERNMIGNELHDSLAQSLVSMRLQIKMLGELLHKGNNRPAQKEVQNLRSAVEEAHTSLRELLGNFRTRMDGRGLFPTIQDLLLRLKGETGISTFFQNEMENPEYQLSPVQEVQIFHIIQEALANARKHSNACTLRVLISGDEDRCTILVEDDGLGFPDNIPSSRPGEQVGLSIMQQRAARLPGIIDIESEAGEGTRICLLFSPNGNNDITSLKQYHQELTQ